MYYKRRLLFAAIDAIMNRVSPKVKQWLDEGPKSRERIELFPSNRPRTRAKSYFLQKIASSYLRP